jgi:hypothetical protein
MIGIFLMILIYKTKRFNNSNNKSYLTNNKGKAYNIILKISNQIKIKCKIHNKIRAMIFTTLIYLKKLKTTQISNNQVIKEVKINQLTNSKSFYIISTI